MVMQDKFAVGPVTFVQLVGLNAKPQIPSARADGAARAADHPPPSAAAGLGGEPQVPVSEIESSYFAVKPLPALGVSADPLRANIAFDSGVDRPVADAASPTPKIDPSMFVNLPFKPVIPDPEVDSRPGPADPGADVADKIGNVPTPPVSVSPDPASDDAGIGKTVAGLDYVFDGENEFGDDQILDFELAASEMFVASASGILSGDDVTVTLDGSTMNDWGMFDIIDCSGGHSSEPTLMSFDEFIAPEHMVSATDAVPLI